MTTRAPQEMADELSLLLRSRLGIRGGATLSQKLIRARTLLPAKVRRAGQEVAQAAARGAHPRLMKQVDLPALEDAFRLASDHLKAIDPRERRKDWLLGAAASLAVNLLLLGAAIAGLVMLLPA